MAFQSSDFDEEPGEVIWDDPFREVEMALAFKQIECFACDLVSIYKYRVQQVRRKDPVILEDNRELSEDERSRWAAIPRFAEIPETIRCKRCGEILTLETDCVF